MAFTEDIKKTVRQKAAYQCCRCRIFGVEVHHILPQKDGGSDMIDNAAPLCPNCHTDFGDNPDKRKIITEMRDWWYEIVEQMFGGRPGAMNLLEKIDKEVADIKDSHSTNISELKRLIRQLSNQAVESITVKDIGSTTSAAVSSVRLADKVHADFKCKICGTYIGLLIGSNVCPNCKNPIN